MAGACTRNWPKGIAAGYIRIFAFSEFQGRVNSAADIGATYLPYRTEHMTVNAQGIGMAGFIASFISFGYSKDKGVPI